MHTPPPPLTSPERALAWVAFLDVYGFSNMVTLARAEPAVVFNRLIDAHAELRRTLQRRAPFPHLALFSDSILITYPISQDSPVLRVLHRCYDDLRTVISILARHRFIARGAVAMGNVAFAENIVVGDAVLKAVSYERLIRAPIIILPAAELPDKVENDAIGLRARLINVPTRTGGLIRAVVALPEEVNSLISLLEKELIATLTNGPFDSASAWSLALDLVRACLPKS